MAASVVTRFAPSPTGYLHIGGARTALYSWLLARHHGTDGRYLLRIEDTDAARSTEQAAAQLLEDLRWLGLHWDNDHVEYQSKRRHVYDPIIEDLIARGPAYRAYETRDELDAMRKEAERQKRQFVYRRRPLSDQQAREFAEQARPHVVRFAMPVREWRFTDAVLGEIVMPADEVQDFVIRKEDGMPTYHFAVVVDDEEMGITHVMRGQEHVKNTFNHIALQEALGYRRPIFAHLSTIQNPDGSKMGKRDRDKKVREFALLAMKRESWTQDELAKRVEQELERTLDSKTLEDLAYARLPESFEDHFKKWLGDSKQQLWLSEQPAVTRVTGFSESQLPEVSIHDFRKNGYLPHALLNFLALLGWSPGENRERMSMAEMVELFSLDRIGKANPKFDRAKLLAFNTEAGAATPPEKLVKPFRQYLEVNPDSPLNRATDEQLAKLLEMKKGFRLLREVDEASRFLFVEDDAVVYDADALDKVLRKSDRQGVVVLRDVRGVLADVAEWTAGALEHAIEQYGESKQLGLGKVAQPLRVAVSGGTISPPIFQSLEFLGREHTLARIDRCLVAA